MSESTPAIDPALLKRTPLHALHIAHGARMVPFAGYDMPVQYASGVLKEHLHTRSAAGLFDVSHMGEIHVSGLDSEKFIQRLVTNDIAGAREHKVIYSPMCYPDGGVVDDLLVYKYSNTEYLIIVNAKVTTLDRQNPVADAVAIRDGRFLAVGTEAEVRAVSPEAEVIDAGGRRKAFNPAAERLLARVEGELLHPSERGDGAAEELDVGDEVVELRQIRERLKAERKGGE